MANRYVGMPVAITLKGQKVSRGENSENGSTWNLFTS